MYIYKRSSRPGLSYLRCFGDPARCSEEKAKIQIGFPRSRPGNVEKGKIYEELTLNSNSVAFRSFVPSFAATLFTRSTHIKWICSAPIKKSRCAQPAGRAMQNEAEARPVFRLKGAVKFARRRGQRGNTREGSAVVA